MIPLRSDLGNPESIRLDNDSKTIESYQVALKKRHIDNQVQRRLLFENHQVY
jgi:hypothetical protein